MSLYQGDRHGRKMLVGVAAVTFKRAGAAKVRLVLTRAGRERLRGARRLRVSARAGFRVFGQCTTSVTRRLTLKR
jgi:hypothetical protein